MDEVKVSASRGKAKKKPVHLFSIYSICSETSMTNTIARYVIAGVCVVVVYQFCEDVLALVKETFRSFIEKRIMNDLVRSYEIDKTLGWYSFHPSIICSGKTSIIYRAKRISDGKIIAVKVINAFDPILIRSNAFMNEWSILERCHHPNIVSFFGTRQSMLYKVLEIEYSSDGCVHNNL